MSNAENNVRPVDANEILSHTFVPTGTVHKSYIESSPTLDVMQVVRCKNCIHRASSEFCECRDDDAFCSDGEAADGTVPEQVGPEPLNGHTLHLINDLYAQIENLKHRNLELHHRNVILSGHLNGEISL